MNYFGITLVDAWDESYTKVRYDYTASDRAHISGFATFRGLEQETEVFKHLYELTKEGATFDVFIYAEDFFDTTIAHVSTQDTKEYFNGEEVPEPADEERRELIWTLVNCFNMPICPSLIEPVYDFALEGYDESE